ncbi:MAG: insulinase family protein, partial [Bacteroidia bacterium]|nr:insulinase family protein [Bacteroidia bacterium]
MRTLLIGLIYILIRGISFGQQSQTEPGGCLYVQEYKLKNGLTVFLNEDHNQPTVFGGVVVKGGAKRDPEDATGIAHYFEHIMFKGTDKMGTVDYESEKIYLDSIRQKYDELGAIADKEEREKIQQKINSLSLKAMEYAIPNELDKIIAGSGGTNLNAGTSEDMIVYYNLFPGNQIEKWLEIYSHRFINPVFRLFQSELETVYEEKNMSMDNIQGVMFETYLKNFYKKHPYGQHTVLGSIEHLKNPSLTKMMEYFNTYYVANNMALILCGDFDTEKIKPLIEEKFGIWRSGEIPPMPEYNEQPFNGREFVSKRLTPIKIGMLGFRAVPSGHKDEPTLEIIHNLLSNEATTGLLDKLYMDNKYLYAGVIPNNNIDYGSTIFFCVPKLIGQSLKSVEKMILDEVEKIKRGEIDSEMLEAIKLNLKKDHFRDLESMYWRGYSIVGAFVTGKTWEDMLKEPEEIDKITKEDVVRIANQYFGDNYLAFYSKTGFPKKEKLKKPEYKPLIPKNIDKKSEFALHIENMEETPMVPRFIEFNKDVLFSDLQENVHFYYTPNPVNNIFTITIKAGVGEYKYPILSHASQFISLLGTENKSFDELKKTFQKIGSDFYAYSNDDYLFFNIEGLDEKFDETLLLLNELLTKIKPDKKQLKKLIRETKAGFKFERKEPWTIGEALFFYALYKDKSRFINRLSISQIKKLFPDTLITAIREALKYETEIHYSGTLEYDKVKSNIKEKLTFFPEVPIKSESPVTKPREQYKEDNLFLLNDKRMIQSQIYLTIEGEKISEEDRVNAEAFNEYFGNEMHSIVFQEIREFRSLAYSAYANFKVPFRNGEQGFIMGFMSTQSDKTGEALEIFDSL